MKNRRFTAWYQLFYGFIGTLYNAYLLLLALNANQNVQVVLAMCFFTVFSLLVFLAGLSRYKIWKGNLMYSLIIQAVQIASISISELYLNLRCGTSVNVKYNNGTFTTDLDVTDFASELSWKIVSSSTYGINIFAIVFCVILIIEDSKKKPDSLAPADASFA